MVTQNKLKFSEFIDLILARLYELEQTEGGGSFFDLNAIAKELKEAPPQQWVFDAGKVLESRGLAQVVFTMGGGCHAMLAGEGRLFVEQEQGTGIIKQYHQAPQNYVVIRGSGNQVVVGGDQGTITQSMSIEKEREPAFKLLEQIRDRLGNDASLGEAEKKDLLTDVQGIEQQLKKREPNRQALAGLLESLSQVASVAGHVANLIRLFNQ